MKIHISSGNMKLGGIPNLSLPPIKTCCKNLPCYEKCYAMKSYRQYPNVRKNWNENLKLWQEDPVAFKCQLWVWLGNHNPKYFRWFVGGDCPDVAFYKMMLETAGEYPKTKFLAFTKQYLMLGAAHPPKNLQLIFSRWPGLDATADTTLHRQAWLYDPRYEDVYITDGAKKCPGSCAKCKYCWNGEGDVVFKIH